LTGIAAKRKCHILYENRRNMTIKERLLALKQSLHALYFAYKRKDVSTAVKMLLMLMVIYMLSPIDLIPDFIPVLGCLDDVIILPVLMYFALKLIPEEIMAECWREAADLWKRGKPKKWYYATPVIMI
jgi:uncharacterized membrane protein YkvA (DUF1232 family)